MASTDYLIDLIGTYDNLNEPEPIWNHQSTVIGLTVPFLICSWTCIVSRLYTRIRIVHSPGWDDILVAMFLVSGTMNGICLCVASKFGLGQHILLLSENNLVRFLQSHYVANASYCMSTALIKLSLLFQYLRIFERGRMRLVCICMLWITGVWGLLASILAWFNCNPVYGYWDWAAAKHCWGFASIQRFEFFATYAAHAATNMVLDFIVLSIPLPLIFRDSREKRRLYALFAVGGLVSGISIWRMVVIAKHKAATYPTFDPTWYGPPVVVLGMMEVNAASMCASIPVFWPAISQRIDQIFITKEVKVTREQRFSSDNDEDIELRDKGGVHVRSASVMSESCDPLTKAANTAHYGDEFITIQVDPLRANKHTVAAVTSERTPWRLEKKRSEKSLL
ncbi:hypothetical protein BX600DRAFT_506655 [Xylariales sp. PMI_506]|nr:hypothetical protein BX600DRAFT_506655 [Xylariales sp. PMI_506]